MLHRHGYGGKRSTKATTGVADYFAVLGIDSFLPPQQQNDINNSDIPSSPPSNSNDDSVVPNDNNNNDNTEEKNERSPSVQTIQTNNLTSSTAKTPKNSNLSSSKQQQLPIPEEETSVGNDNSGDDNEESPSNDTNKVQHTSAMKMNKEEYKLHQQRFQREIIEVQLISNESSSTNLDDRWTICNGESIPIVRETTSTTNNSVNDMNLGSVQLAYRRRGSQQQHTTSDENEREEEYYKPGIADVAIHYVKVRPSTIPNNYFASLNNNMGQQHQQHQQSQEEQYPTQEETASTTSSSQQQQQKKKSILSSGISNLAKQGAGLAVASGIGLGKGLVNVVKSKIDTSSQHDDSYTEQHDNNNTATAMATTPLKRNKNIHSTKATPGLYDIGIENNNSFETDFDGQNKYFQDTHGDVKLWSPRVSSPSVVGVGTMKKRREHFFPDTPAPPPTKGSSNKEEEGESSSDTTNTNGIVHKPLHEMIPIPPTNYDEEWIIPNFCKVLQLPTPELVAHRQHQQQQQRRRQDPILVDRTHAISGSERSNVDSNVTSPSSVGMEAMYLSPTNAALSNNTPRGDTGMNSLNSPVMLSHTSSAPDPNYLPVFVKSIPSSTPNSNINTAATNNDEHVYIPILAIRYQRTGEPERYHEDASIVDIHVTKLDDNGIQPKIVDDADSEEEDDEFADDFATIRNANVLLQNMVHVDILKKTPWKLSSSLSTNHNLPGRTPIILLKHNIPNGYADIPFPSKVLDRFPSKNYRILPFPEEELPMFCYAKGSTLVRDQLCNIGLPKAYGFVVKNERGDSIYGTCYLCVCDWLLLVVVVSLVLTLDCLLLTTTSSCFLSIMLDIYGTIDKSKEGRA